MFRLVVSAAVLALACGASLGPVPRDVQSRIVAGDTFDIASVPWQVAIQYDINGEGMYLMICGGTIVSNRYIMVSAWCLVYKTGLMWIRMGSDSHDTGGTIYSVRSSKIHPNYNSTTKDYDVALMQLSIPITLGSNIRIATLPAQDEAVPVNTEGFASGWGATSENGGRPSLLRKIDLTVTDQDECLAVYEGEREVTERMFCAGGKLAGTCDGDTGGPFVVDGVVVGITSWRRGCGREGIPDVFTKVSSVREWIRGEI